MTPPPLPSWHARLTDLVTGGAEIVINQPDTAEVTVWPLARHLRINHDDQVVWLRPLTGHPDDASFTHDNARRHGLRHTNVHVHTSGHVEITTPAGQTIHIRPLTTGDSRALLDAWDTFISWTLPANVEADLDQLTDDSW